MRRLLLAILLLAAPAVAQSDGDPAIDARRLGVMLDQSDAALHAISASWTANAPTTDDDGDAYAALVSAVARYDATLAQACRAKLVGPQFCGAPYDPPWLKTKPSAAGLRAAIDEAEGRITPFWSTVCAEARKATGDPAFCAIE